MLVLPYKSHISLRTLDKTMKFLIPGIWTPPSAVKPWRGLLCTAVPLLAGISLETIYLLDQSDTVANELSLQVSL
jgi:hypothetical protein